MSKQPLECDESQLAVLVDGDEQSDAFRHSAEHLESCAHCQTRLTALVADAGTWNDVAESLREGAVVHDSAAARIDFLAPPSHPEMLGRLGRYEIESVIGSGGMGVVLKAHDSELNRPVAIKVLAPHLAHNGAARQRFAREGRAAAAVVHEHVMAIHNVESDADNPFLVMQYVSGQSLQTRLEQQAALGVKEILRIGAQAADGLSAAHAQGVVHRDVKPSNILLENGVERVVLSDFGLARAVDDASVTRQGTLTGTPEYMSPEQAKGEAVDHRSDLFSLGSVLYAMCTGHSPFRGGTTLGVLRRIADETPRSIQEINPDIPDWLEDIVEKLLAKDASQRFQSAEEVGELLGQWLAHLQAPETKPRPRAPAARRTRRLDNLGWKPLLQRRKYWITALSVFYVAIVASAVIFVSGDGGVAWLPARDAVHNRFALIPIRTLKGHASPVYTLAFSPDGKTLATAGSDAWTRLWDVATGQEKTTLTGHTKGVRFLAFSPNGSLLATASADKTIVLWDVATGEKSLTLVGHDGPASGVSFSPDGATCATVGDDRTVRLWDVATGEQKARLQRHNGAVWAVAFSPDGKRVVSGSDDMRMHSWDSTNGEELGGMKGHHGGVRALAFNSTGSILASGSLDHTIKLWNPTVATRVSGGREFATLKGHTEPVVSLSFSPDDKTLASGSWDGTIKLWDVATRTEKTSFTPHTNWVWAVSFSPNGKIFASASRDNTVKLWRVPTREASESKVQHIFKHGD